MPEMVQVDPEVVKRETNRWRRHLKNPVFDFDKAIQKRDSLIGSGRLSSEANTSANSFEHFLGTYSAFKDSAVKLLTAPGGDYRAKELFVDVYSIYAGAAAGISKIDSFEKPVKAVPVLGKNAIDFNRGEKLLLDDLIMKYIEGTSRCGDGETLIAQTKDFFDWMMCQAGEKRKEEKFEDLVKQAESAHIRVNGIIVNGFHYRSFDKIQTTPASYKREDYVGNRELLDTMSHSLTELFDYDFRSKKNPQMDLGGFQQTMTVWGEGGMGKSMGIAIALNDARERAAKNGIPFFVRELRGFKSEYFAKSAQNLREIFEDIKKGDAVYAIVAEDIDTIFYARDELKNRPEDKDILGEIMNHLEGITSNTLGNYVFIATSNHPLQGDGPLMDRLRQCQIHVEGPQTNDDYVSVFKAKLRDGINAGYVKVNNWDKVGEAAAVQKRQKQAVPVEHVDHPLSNRDIRNISLNILTQTKGYARPENFYTMDYTARIAFLRSQRKPVDDSVVAGAIGKYVQGIAEQKQKEFESAISNEMQRLRMMDEVSKRYKGRA